MRRLVSFKVVTATVTEALFGYLVFVCYGMRLTSAIVHMKALSTSFSDAPARFAVGINNSGICGALHLADPLDACSSLLNGFGYADNRSIRFALIVRGKCTFEEKIRNAQDGGFHAAIVYDDQDNRNLVSMIGNSEGIWVHAVFVSNVAGETLKKRAQAEECECRIIPSLGETEWNVLILSVISLLVIVSVLAAFFFTRNRRRNQQGINHQLDSKVVEVLPRFTFSTARLSSYTGETCAICLEDYKDGESLRVLPCHHEFHASCVDSWLTKWGTFCPVCKHNMSTEASHSEDFKWFSLPNRQTATGSVSAAEIKTHQFFLMASQPSSEAEVVTVDVQAAKDLIRSGYHYLDVRTEDEFKKGNVDVENVLNIPYMFNTPEGRVKNPKFMEQVSSACSKDDHFVVGCQTGVRSVYATTDLLRADFKSVYNMGGGYVAWVENGFATKKAEVGAVAIS